MGCEPASEIELTRISVYLSENAGTPSSTDHAAEPSAGERGLGLYDFDNDGIYELRVFETLKPTPSRRPSVTLHVTFSAPTTLVSANVFLNRSGDARCKGEHTIESNILYSSVDLEKVDSECFRTGSNSLLVTAQDGEGAAGSASTSLNFGRDEDGCTCEPG